MLRVLIFTSLLILSTFAATSPSSEAFSTLWNAWKSLYGKVYSPEEEQIRFQIFIESYYMVKKYNDENPSSRLTLNKFSDQPSEDPAESFLPPKPTPKESGSYILPSIEFDQNGLPILPKTLDWRLLNVVTPVKDQGSCLSSYAFATTGALEAYHAIRNLKLQSFSEQQIVDCYKTSTGCKGGLTTEGIAYVNATGIQTEDSYPYTGVSGTCSLNTSETVNLTVKADILPYKNVTALKMALLTQPIPVWLNINTKVFKQYKSGVMTKCEGIDDHHVLVVGWDVIDGQEAWIIKNSWGKDWGVDGYVYLATEPAGMLDMGLCDILSEPLVLIGL